MGSMRGSVGRKGKVIALAMAAGLSLAAQGALAQHHGGHSASSGSGHFSSSGSGHSHSSGSGHFSGGHHFSGGPRIVVAPAFPRRFYYVPAPYYYTAPPVYASAAPMVAPALNNGYWYFCPDNRLYYPQALECPSGWLQVVPNGGGY